MTGDENKLKTRQGRGFRQEPVEAVAPKDETWEADFRALPKPISQSATHYVGMVLTQPDGYLRAEEEIDKSPTVNDLATLCPRHEAALWSKDISGPDAFIFEETRSGHHCFHP